jgi:ABC-type lipoprotein export system ATPase subunit
VIVQCQALTKQYKDDGRPRKAVDGVDLMVEEGDFVVILGHSGSGKTTLLSLIGGLTKPEQGRVLVKGIENWQQSDNALAAMRNRTVGFIFQFASLIPTLTVLEN